MNHIEAPKNHNNMAEVDMCDTEEKLQSSIVYVKYIYIFRKNSEIQFQLFIPFLTNICLYSNGSINCTTGINEGDASITWVIV